MDISSLLALAKTLNGHFQSNATNKPENSNYHQLSMDKATMNIVIYSQLPFVKNKTVKMAIDSYVSNE